jgi:hypothetical protein
MVDEEAMGASERPERRSESPGGKRSAKLTPDERGLMLLRLVHRGKYTSVSMDVELWRVLVLIAGGEEPGRRWVIEQARLIEALEGTATGIEGAKGAGLSRLIQRRVFELIQNRLGVAKK